MKNPVNDFVTLSIRRIRLAKGLRVQDMAERSGIPLGSYSCLETGRYRINLENLFRIINVLGVDISEVWPKWSEESRPPVEKVNERFIQMAIREAKRYLPSEISLTEILDIVCDEFEITRDELESPSRKRHLAAARTVAAALTREQRHLTMV